MAKGFFKTMRLVTHVNDALLFELSLAAFFDHAAKISRTNRMESAFKFAEALELTPFFQQVVQTVATLERTEALRAFDCLLRTGRTVVT
jgi:hypothetical protein